jgi:hypothetical protein
LFDESGIAYLRGAVDVTGIEDAIWEFFAARGVARDDPATWPSQMIESKLQRLRKTGLFKPFGNDTVSAAISEVLGEGWHEPDAWGAALITFPAPGPWVLPRKMWHADIRAQGSPDRLGCLRMFGFVSEVVPQGGGTLVIEGSHELIRRKVAAAPGHDAGSSAQVKKQLFREREWFNAPDFEGTVIDGVHVRVRELTGQPGDVAYMLPWTLHNVNMNCSDHPRFMVTHTAFAR